MADYVQYSGKENDHLETTIENNIDNLVNILETKYLSAVNLYKPVDFARLAHYFSIDLIWDIAFGKVLGDLINDQDTFGYIETVESAIPMFNLVGVYPWFSKVFGSRLFSWLLPSDKDLTGLGKVMGYVLLEIFAQECS